MKELTVEEYIKALEDYRNEKLAIRKSLIKNKPYKELISELEDIVEALKLFGNKEIKSKAHMDWKTQMYMRMTDIMFDLRQYMLIEREENNYL